MAISEDLPHVEVTITVDGQALKEYRDDELEEVQRTTIRYIEAKSDQTFAVHLKFGEGIEFMGDVLAPAICVDGHWSLAAPFLKKSDYINGIRRLNSEGDCASDGKLRKYQFAALETASDGYVLKGEFERTKDLGAIRIDINHLILREHTGTWRPLQVDEAIVSEKALNGQALSHRVRLADPVQGPKPNVYRSIAVPGAPRPAAVFTFKYRSIGALKAEGLVPRTPTPPPLEERDIDSLSRDELLELQRRAKARREEQESKVRVKRERMEEQEEQEENRRRKSARTSARAARLELDEDDDFREGTLPAETRIREIVELD